MRSNSIPKIVELAVCLPAILILGPLCFMGIMHFGSSAIYTLTDPYRDIATRIEVSKVTIMLLSLVTFGFLGLLSLMAAILFGSSRQIEKATMLRWSLISGMALGVLAACGVLFVDWAGAKTWFESTTVIYTLLLLFPLAIGVKHLYSLVRKV